MAATAAPQKRGSVWVATTSVAGLQDTSKKKRLKRRRKSREATYHRPDGVDSDITVYGVYNNGAIVDCEQVAADSQSAPGQSGVTHTDFFIGTCPALN